MGISALTGRLARRASLLALGVVAVHQVRYALACGADASSALAHQGHGYLGDLAPLLATLALSVVGARLVAAATGALGRDESTASRRGEPIVFAGVLLAIFCAQELAEGALVAGHPGGVAAVLANGGWLAVPVALAVGALVACFDRLLAGAESVLAERAARAWRPTYPARSASLPAAPALVVLATRTLAFGLARRPPPAPARG